MVAKLDRGVTRCRFSRVAQRSNFWAMKDRGARRRWLSIRTPSSMLTLANPLTNRTRTSSACAATVCRSLGVVAGEARRDGQVRRSARQSTWPLAGGWNLRSENGETRQERREDRSEAGGGRDKRVGSLGALSPWGRSEFPGIFFEFFFEWLPPHA